MGDDKTQHVHIDFNEVRKDMIGVDAEGHCAKCHGELEQGFGFAGGGYGVYSYCPKCEEVVEKTEVGDI